MNLKHITSISAVLGAFALSPGIANASFVLDTGTPTSTSGPALLNSSQWLAGEFAVTAGEDITSLSAYLTQGAGQVGDTFNFDIYSNSGFINGRSYGNSLVYSATGTYTASGWNTTAVNWVPTATGSYWLALQLTSGNKNVSNPSGRAEQGLDASVEASATTGTVPALGFAYLGSGTLGQYTTAGASPIGLQINAAPVPLPAAVWLLGSAVAGLGAMQRRRRQPMSARRMI
jgi:hypothetical protein